MRTTLTVDPVVDMEPQAVLAASAPTIIVGRGVALRVEIPSPTSPAGRQAQAHWLRELARVASEAADEVERREGLEASRG